MNASDDRILRNPNSAVKPVPHGDLSGDRLGSVRPPPHLEKGLLCHDGHLQLTPEAIDPVRKLLLAERRNVGGEHSAVQRAAVHGVHPVEVE